MSKAKKIFTNARVLILIGVLLMAVAAINPRIGVDGVAIRSIAQNSSASAAKMESPQPGSSPMSKERILSINNREVNSVQEYYAEINSMPVGTSFALKTNKGLYRLSVEPLIKETILNETELKLVNETILVNKNN